MNALATLRRKRRSAHVLSVTLLAWMGVLLSPCALALSADTSMSHDIQNVGVHADGPETKPSHSTTETDCCCYPSVVMLFKAPEVNKFSLSVAVPMDLSTSLWMLSDEEAIDPQRLRPHATLPPVYFATQRLRI